MIVPIFVCFVTFVIIYYTILSIVTHKNRPISKLDKYLKQDAKNIGSTRTPRKKVDYHFILKTIGDKISRGSFFKKYKDYMDLELEGADILLKSEELAGICMLTSLAAFFLFYIMSSSIFISAIMAGICWNIPVAVVKSKKNRRMKEIGDQLGDTLTLISNSLKAGYSFLQSIEAVSKEMQPPISREFSKMLREIYLGLTTEEALTNLLNRLKNDDVEMMVTAVMIQRQVGGNLAEILDNISSTIRDRIRIKGEIKALTAQGRMSGIVISILPVFIGVVFFLMSPEYMGRMFKHPIGLSLIGMGVIMEIVGIFLIRKIVNIQV